MHVEAVKWAGIAYLMVLGVQAFISAARGRYSQGSADDERDVRSLRGWRQGFLSNIPNPKVLVFYLAVLPQFLGAHASFATLLLFALGHAALSLMYLLILLTGLNRARRLLARRRVRRSLDIATGTALVGFGARLATEHA